MLDERTRFARALFGGIAPRYGGPAEMLSFGQYSRWRRALVRSLPLRSEDLVLDVATGTGLIARRIRRTSRARVVGVDRSEAMMASAHHLTNAGADANALPFGDATFDVVIFSYLLRYVDRPAATLHELTRVLKPGGVLASVEFGVPHARWARAGWRTYALHVFPRLARAFGRGWRDVGAFLGTSIEDWARDWPLERQLDAWRAAGVDPQARELSLGAGIIISGSKR